MDNDLKLTGSTARPESGADDSEKNKKAKDEAVKSEKLSSNAASKERTPSEHVDISADQDKRSSPSTSGPKGTEEPGSDEGPGGTGW